MIRELSKRVPLSSHSISSNSEPDAFVKNRDGELIIEIRFQNVYLRTSPDSRVQAKVEDRGTRVHVEGLDLLDEEFRDRLLEHLTALGRASLSGGDL